MKCQIKEEFKNLIFQACTPYMEPEDKAAGADDNDSSQLAWTLILLKRIHLKEEGDLGTTFISLTWVLREMKILIYMMCQIIFVFGQIKSNSMITTMII
jgi:hypothetical protein